MHGPFDTYKEFDFVWFGLVHACNCAFMYALHLHVPHFHRYIVTISFHCSWISTMLMLSFTFFGSVRFSAMRFVSFHFIWLQSWMAWTICCHHMSCVSKCLCLSLFVHWNKRRRCSEMQRKNKRLGQNRRNVHVYINWRGCCFLVVLSVPPCDCVITIDRAWLWRTHYYHFTVDWTKLQYT